MADATTATALSFPMNSSRKILRRSTHIFIQDRRRFASMWVLLALPFSVSLLLTLGFVVASYPSVLANVHDRLRGLFDAAGFPANREFFQLLKLKLSQTIVISFITLPFSITFLLFTKSCVIASLNIEGAEQVFPVSLSSFAETYKPVLETYVCNYLFILSANASAFSILFLAFNCMKGIYAINITAPGNLELFVSAAGAILYSVILAHALVVCNLALVLSGSEKIGGPSAILKACVMIGGSTSTSLSIALLVNLAFAATEALFQFRVIWSYQKSDLPRLTVAVELLVIAYLYSMLIVFDTIVSCIFYRSCREKNPLFVDRNEGGRQSQIEIDEEHRQLQLER